jgi:hypothetical protein
MKITSPCLPGIVVGDRLSSSSSGRITAAKQPRFRVSPPELAVGETAMLPVGMARTQSVLNILAQKLGSA